MRPVRFAMRPLLIAVALVLPLFAQAAPNLLVNGSFEWRLDGWTLSDNAGGYPVVPIAYNFAPPAPGSSFGIVVAPDDAAGNPSPDAAGNLSAYFVSAFSAPQSLSQQLSLAAGTYDVGFDVLRQSGSPSNFSASLLGQALSIDSVNYLATGSARGWLHVSQQVTIASAGSYALSLNFGSAFSAGNDVLIDRAYVISAVPEPASLALLLAGLGFIGMRARRAR